MSRLTIAIEQIRFARTYTLRLLNATREEDWLGTPGVTHIAWQVGHMAVSEYRLVFERVLGEPDSQLFSDGFRQPFVRDSVPVDVTAYPSAPEIRAVFDRVHERALAELQGLDENVLDEPVLTPHLFVKTKKEALMWCGQHEFVHAGQIGLLRRLLGYSPVW